MDANELKGAIKKLKDIMLELTYEQAVPEQGKDAKTGKPNSPDKPNGQGKQVGQDGQGKKRKIDFGKEANDFLDLVSKGVDELVRQNEEQNKKLKQILDEMKQSNSNKETTDKKEPEKEKTPPDDPKKGKKPPQKKPPKKPTDPNKPQKVIYKR